MQQALLNWALTRANSPAHADFASRILPLLERWIPTSPRGAELVRSLAADERWSARYLAARAIGKLTPDLIGLDEAWQALLRLAEDEERLVREAVPRGLGELVVNAPAVATRLERLLTDGSAPIAARRAAVRSLVVVAVTPATAALGERLLRQAALAREPVSGIGAVIIARGIGGRDPVAARAIARAWLASDQPALQAAGARALQGEANPRCSARPVVA